MYQHLTKLHLAGLVAALGFAGRRLSVLVLSLAIVLAFAGVTQAKKPEGTPGGPSNGPGGPSNGDDDGPLWVSQYSAPLVALDEFGEPIGEIPNTLAEINNRGKWSLTTTGLSMVQYTYYDICLHTFSDPSVPADERTLLLGTFESVDGTLTTGIRDPEVNVDGIWQAPSIRVQVDADVNVDCEGAIIQESGIQQADYGVSKFSAPFVALEGVNVIGEVEGSTAQISKSGYWYLATSGLKRRQRYDICLFDPVGNRTIVLQDRRSLFNGNLYGDGNAVSRGFTGNWQALSFQIMEEPEDDWPNCDEDFLVQESGIEIKAP